MSGQKRETERLCRRSVSLPCQWGATWVPGPFERCTRRGSSPPALHQPPRMLAAPPRMVKFFVLLKHAVRS